MIQSIRRFVVAACLTMTVLIGGCAPAYHSYSGCRVNCQYCPPPPLPVACYDGCQCHSRAALPYLSERAETRQVVRRAHDAEADDHLRAQTSNPPRQR